MITPPCKQCTRRTMDCHSTCEGYKHFKEEYNKELEVIEKKKHDLYATIIRKRRY